MNGSVNEESQCSENRLDREARSPLRVNQESVEDVEDPITICVRSTSPHDCRTALACYGVRGKTGDRLDRGERV
jgi:hypothetical protein